MQTTDKCRENLGGRSPVLDSWALGPPSWIYGRHPTSTGTMRFGIIGAGAIGCVVGAAHQKGGHDVTLVDQWPDHLEAIKRVGLRLSGTCGVWAGRMQLMVTIEDPAVIQGILAHLGLPSVVAAARAEQPDPGARATPEVCAERPGGRRPARRLEAPV